MALQPLNGGPRSTLTQAEVLDSLSWQLGARIRWGVDMLTRQGDPLEPTAREFDTESQWDTGTHDGTTASGGTLTIS